jgi:hypothetical protein
MQMKFGLLCICRPLIIVSAILFHNPSLFDREDSRGPDDVCVSDQQCARATKSQQLTPTTDTQI